MKNALGSLLLLALLTGCFDYSAAGGTSSDGSDGGAAADGSTSVADAGSTSVADAGAAGTPEDGGARPDAGVSPPNLMFVVDRSGSMQLPIDPNNPNCGTCGPGSPCDPNVCPTRWSELQAATEQFLHVNGGDFAAGLVFFPRDSACGAPAQADITVHVPAASSTDLQVHAAMMAEAIATAPAPQGGTPTGGTLTMLADYPPLIDPSAPQRQVALLLTDGLPNCNASNPNSFITDPAACQCTLASGQCPSPFERLGCLDKEATVDAIHALRARGIETVVVGFSSEVSADTAAEVLDAMAEAGGLPRSCPNGTDAECGASAPCEISTRLCARRYYAAGNGTELFDALMSLGTRIAN